MATKRATIREVALLAGVSVSTVSNCLNGRVDCMRADTLERVRRAIVDLDYVANGIARNLKLGQSPIIGLIVPSVANPFWGALARSLEEAALARDFQVVLGNGERDPEREQRYAESLWAHGVHGLIFGSSLLSLDHLGDLVRRGMHIVAFDRRVQPTEPVQCDSVTVDNVHGAQLAIEHLLELGHRRIGFISGPVRTVNRLERLEGYRTALTNAGIEPDPDLIWDVATTGSYGDTEGVELGRVAAGALLERADPPTALFATNDFYALGACAGLADLGITVPDTVSVVGFDDIMLAGLARPPLTTVRQPLAEIASTAVSLLIDRLAGTKTGSAECHELTPELVVRGSTSRVESDNAE